MNWKYFGDVEGPQDLVDEGMNFLKQHAPRVPRQIAAGDCSFLAVAGDYPSPWPPANGHVVPLRSGRGHVILRYIS